MVDVEKALRLVRMAAALIAGAAALGVRTQGSAHGLHGLAAAAAIVAGAVTINLLTLWTSHRGWRAVTALGGQLLDVAGSLALVILLDKALDGSGWMVMLLPIVIGGVRFGAAGTLLAWTLACAGYLGLAVGSVITLPGSRADAFGTSLQRFAFLLALAVPVAALTQWLQQRWEHQRRLTVAAALRAERLELIEGYARSFIGSTEPRLLANLADAGVGLGFPTVTITLHSEERSITAAAVGRSRPLPTDDVSLCPEPGETLVTHWETDDGSPLTSVSITLDATGSSIAFHGWSTEEVSTDLAQSFGLLGAHAGVALKAARMQAALERQAKQDPLTTLLNRRAFDEQVDRCAADGRSVALLLLDVDHFKQINDGYGHPAGDKVLRVIAERLRASCAAAGEGAGAWAARIGGDEFAVLLADVALEQVADVADRIEASMQAPVAADQARIPVTFSIGIADAVSGWTPRDLIAAADEATYQAKNHGRNRSCWAPGPVGDDISLQEAAERAEVRRTRSITHTGAPELSDAPGNQQYRSLMNLLEQSMETRP
jgi:diguanylate cyclase (GGDEF)-like protein